MSNEVGQGSKPYSDPRLLRTLGLSSDSVGKAPVSWQMRRGNLSPRYTTEWDSLAVVQARCPLLNPGSRFTSSSFT